MLYTFTEQEYLSYLYNEGRCNIQYIDDKPRNELVLIIGRRGTKCHSENSFITTTIGTITFKELLSRLNNNETIGIFTYTSNLEKKVTFDIKAESNGPKPILEVITQTGKSEEVTYNHPYLIYRNNWTEPKWIQAKDLLKGDVIATARSQGIWGTSSIGSDKAKILGYLAGLNTKILISNYGVNTNIKINLEENKFNFKKIILDINSLLAKDFPGSYLYQVKRTSTEIDYALSELGFSSWLKNESLDNYKNFNKEIPTCIKKTNKTELALYLNRLFSCNSVITFNNINTQKHSITSEVIFSVSTKQLSHDIQRELLKFGVICKRHHYYIKESNTNLWKIIINDHTSLLNFIDNIGIFGKENKLKILKKYIKLKNYFNLNTKDNFNNRNFLNNSEIFWDKVDNLLDKSIQPTVALEVKDTNIIGNDIISHNSSLASWIAAYETYKLLKIYHPQAYYRLLPDAEIHLTTIATNEDQSNLLFRQILGHYSQCNYFHRYMSKPTNDHVNIRSRRDLDKYGEEGKSSILIRSAPSSARSLRGPGNILVIMDEQAHFLDDSSQSNKSDKAVYDAITPSVAAFGADGKIINISSPLNKSGMLWDLYNQSLNGAENILMIKAPTWEINNTLAPVFLKGRHQSNPIVYECEFGAEFSDRVKSWMPEEYLRKVIIPDLKPKTFGAPRKPYFLGLDIGFKHDGPAIAVCHVERIKLEDGSDIDTIEVDYCEARYAGEAPYENYDILDFEMIAAWIQEVCNKFYIVKGLLDQHQGIMVHQNLIKKGLNQFDMIYHTRQFNSDLYQNFMMLVIDKKLRLYNDKPDAYSDSDLIDELLKLQMKQYSRNVIEVEAPQVIGGHDDRSDALMRSVWLASEAIKTGLVSSSLSTINNRYSAIRDTKGYQMAKARIHNIPDNRRVINRQRNYSWIKKYG